MSTLVLPPAQLLDREQGRLLTDDAAAQARLVSALRDAAIAGKVDRSVTVLETHISYVLLTGQFAYKIKKSVELFCEVKGKEWLTPELADEIQILNHGKPFYKRKAQQLPRQRQTMILKHVFS